MNPHSINNLLTGIATELPAELTDILLETKDLRLERIVSRNHRSADDFWYQQEQHEWVMVVQGSARLQFEDPPRR